MNEKTITKERLAELEQNEKELLTLREAKEKTKSELPKEDEVIKTKTDLGIIEEVRTPEKETVGETVNSCSDCGTEFDGTPDKCPNCEASFK